MISSGSGQAGSRPGCSGSRMRRRAWTLAVVMAAWVGASAFAAVEAELPALVAAGDAASIRSLGPEVMPVLARLYSQGDVDTRVRIAGLWYQLGWQSPAARDALLADVHTEDETLRVQVQYALSRVSSDDVVVDVLLANLQHDDNPLFRDKAACSLATDQIHLTEAQKVRLFGKLIELLESPTGEVRSLAIRVLHTHTGQAKGFAPFLPPAHRQKAIERWRAWLDEYQANVL